jgi:hypothetical protein
MGACEGVGSGVREQSAGRGVCRTWVTALEHAGASRQDVHRPARRQRPHLLPGGGGLGALLAGGLQLRLQLRLRRRYPGGWVSGPAPGRPAAPEEPSTIAPVAAAQPSPAAHTPQPSHPHPAQPSPAQPSPKPQPAPAPAPAPPQPRPTHLQLGRGVPGGGQVGGACFQLRAQLCALRHQPSVVAPQPLSLQGVGRAAAGSWW